MKRKKSKPITLAQANKRLIKQGPSPMAKVVMEQEGIKLAVSQCGQSIETIRSDVAALSKKIELIASDSSAHLSNVTSSFQKLVADIEGRVSNMEKCIPQTYSPASEVSRGHQLAKRLIGSDGQYLRFVWGSTPYRIACHNPVDATELSYIRENVAGMFNQERQRIIGRVKYWIENLNIGREDIVNYLRDGLDYRDDQ